MLARVLAHCFGSGRARLGGQVICQYDSTQKARTETQGGSHEETILDSRHDRGTRVRAHGPDATGARPAEARHRTDVRALLRRHPSQRRVELHAGRERARPPQRHLLPDQARARLGPVRHRRRRPHRQDARRPEERRGFLDRQEDGRKPARRARPQARRHQLRGAVAFARRPRRQSQAVPAVDTGRAEGRVGLEAAGRPGASRSPG